MNEQMFNVTMQRNIAHLRALLLNDTFAELCPTMTDDERTTLTVQYSDDMQAYILAVDELRNSHVIPLILEVDATAINSRGKIFNKAGVKRELSDTVKAMKLAYYCHTIRKQGSWLEKETMQGTMPGARRRGRPRTAWMDNIKTWTGLPVQESVRMTE